MPGILLALNASLCWGISDFLGGLKARSVPVLQVLGISQPAGLLLLTAVLLAAGHGLPGGTDALLAAAAGVLSITALGLFYAAAAKGSMIVAAPLASTGAVVPVAAGLARGETVTPVLAAGIALALVGAPAAAWQPGGHRPPGGRPRSGGPASAGLALGAGAAAGLWFTLMDLAGQQNPLGAAEIMRLTACAAAAALLAGHRWRGRRRRVPGRPRRRGRAAPSRSHLPAPARPLLPAPARLRTPAWPPASAQLPAPARLRASGLPAPSPLQPSAPAPAGQPGGPAVALLAAPHPPGAGMGRPRLAGRAGAWLAVCATGVTDALAEISFTSAAATGQLSIVSPLSSLFPAITVLLAAAVLRERAHPVQVLGALCAVAGAVLLAL